MSRSTDLWVGRTDDSAIPPRVRLRVFERHAGRCADCGRVLRPGHWQCDHIVSLINDGKHEEGNLQPLCTSPCHQAKTKQDVAVKSKTARVRQKTAGIRRSTVRPMPGSKASGIRKRMDGTVERRT